MNIEYSFWVIFLYGVIHALNPDHLVAISLFSIGKSKLEALAVTFIFALGHGFTLYLMAYFFSSFIDFSLFIYGDLIAGVVIIVSCIYLFYLVFSNKINLLIHEHKKTQHIHVHYVKNHFHNNSDKKNNKINFSLGVLMGIGGVRGMLVTLALVSSKSVDISMIVVFILGVSSVFALLGVIIYMINRYIAQKTIKFIKYTIASIALVSIVIIMNTMLIVIEEI